jgi:four helix bundle protein
MHNFKNLKIWQRGIDLISEIYLLSNSYPKNEIFGLTSQTRRAAVSISLNISEGSAKSSNRDFARFLEMSIGSSNELETLLIIARNLAFIDDKTLFEYQQKITDLRKMIFKFKETLNI